MGMIFNLKKHLFTVLTFTLFISLSFFSSCVFAQENYRGLISEAYMQITDNGKVVKTNKPVIIIYNRNYCSLYIGDKTSHFPVESYTTRIKEGNIEESFLSGETISTKFGWYSINILHNKNGESEITINLPSLPGAASYFVQKAKVYSENGKVSGKVFVNNWKQLNNDFNYNDSLNKLNEKRKIEELAKAHYDDSVNIALKEKEKKETEERKKMLFEEKLNIGNNEYVFKTRDAQSYVTKKIDSAVSVNIRHISKIGKIKLYINRDGNIDSCTNFDYFDSYIVKINEIVKAMTLKVEPFSIDGKAYPSYAIVYLQIDEYFYDNNKNQNKKSKKIGLMGW